MVSGEPVSEGLATMLRRKQRMSEGKTIQDYIVSESQASQKWIDGVTTIDGTIFQFVGTPSASGYFVDSQIAGKDSLASLQIEVMLTKRKAMCIVVKTLTGKSIPIDEVDGDTTAGGLKNLLEKLKGIPMAQQRLIYGGCQLADSKSKMIDIEILTTSGGIDKKLSDYNITHV